MPRTTRRKLPGVAALQESLSASHGSDHDSEDMPEDMPEEQFTEPSTGDDLQFTTEMEDGSGTGVRYIFIHLDEVTRIRYPFVTSITVKQMLEELLWDEDADNYEVQVFDQVAGKPQSGADNPEINSEEDNPEAGAEVDDSIKDVKFITTVEHALKLLSTVNTMLNHNKARSINDALVKLKKDRKSLERVKFIYYLHRVDENKLDEIVEEWKKEKQKGGLNRLNEICKAEIDDGKRAALQKMAESKDITLVGALL